ncbi:Ig-like domain-containing protein [Deinococcus peraridilitoris]|uniref:Uncharacterized protein n=1 Tax=Deinococcus peraridilitoris (strain DSM 19664 / LMG 22246 / CIP 109416 / KR-200) TaxID=937777 RepID=K9ZZC3_DEIPD|nr:Ig-like domain-containing protein [Deinococcus peraridilitoris]AFZ66277.1 hypothetical protein Deipe_0698 [Deinococcus peraridilitoris DSM 19664]
MKHYAWLALPVSVALLTGCGSTPPAPGKIDSLSSPPMLELQSQAKGSGSLSFKNTGGSALTYSTTVTFPKGTPAWLNVTKGASATVQPNASQTVEFSAVCPNVSITSTYTATIALTVGSGSSAVSKTATATLKCVAVPVIETPDTEKPVVTVTAPQNVSVSHVTITGNATDNLGVMRVTYSLNEAAETDLDVQAGTSVALDFSVENLLQGLNTIKVRAYDAAGLVSDVRTLAVSYTPAESPDMVAPELHQASAVFQKHGEGYRLQVTGVASDNMTQASSLKIEYALDGENYSLVAEPTWTDSGFSLYVTNLDLTQYANDAEGHVSVRILDEAGLASGAISAAFLVDTTAPTASLNPVDWTKQSNITITGNVGEANFKSASWTFGNRTGELLKSDVAADGSFSVPLMGIPEGTTTFTLTVTDQAGNQSATPATVEVKADFTAPEAGTVQASPEVVIVPGTVTLSLTPTDAGSGVSSVVFKGNGKTLPATLANGTWTATDSFDAPTSTSYTATVTDSAGNTSQAAAASVTARKPVAPSVIGLVVAIQKGNSSNAGVKATISHEAPSVKITLTYTQKPGGKHPSFTSVIDTAFTGTDFSATIKNVEVGGTVQLKVEDGVNEPVLSETVTVTN